ncbi:hypothetical protein [Clostridium tertium]|uniref:Uncharacterized protein n=1 Tax=Clostridium tertium TaxID=1559 RepID=A0A9X3XGR7_9CLOT|nr:hypothetical protein [Clostridium tertium]
MKITNIIALLKAVLNDLKVMKRYNLRMLKYMNVYFMGELYYKLRITGLY